MKKEETAKVSSFFVQKYLEVHQKTLPLLPLYQASLAVFVRADRRFRFFQ